MRNVCLECGSVWLGRPSKFCSKRCRMQTWHREYKRTTGQGWRRNYQRSRYDRECAYCREAFTTTHEDGLYCSRRCATLARTCRAIVLHPNPRPVWELRPRTKPKAPKQRRWFGGSCARCGEPFLIVDQAAARYCSKKCARLVSKSRHRAAKRGGVVIHYSRREIFERDAWTCRICEKPLRRDVAFNHNLAPSIDHIVPLALGGADSPDNVQAAHRFCNSLKGAALVSA